MYLFSGATSGGATQIRFARSHIVEAAVYMYTSTSNSIGPGKHLASSAYCISKTGTFYITKEKIDVRIRVKRQNDVKI